MKRKTRNGISLQAILLYVAFSSFASVPGLGLVAVFD